MAKEYYYDLLIPEVARYAKIRSMDPEKLDENGAAIFATWYTQNPLELPERDNICNYEEKEPVIVSRKDARKLCGDLRLSESPTPARRPAKMKGVRFTAHTHPSEPLEPSPDDLLIYHSLERKKTADEPAENRLVHFIIDGYVCRKVK